MSKLCINRDKPFVPFLSATQISVCQMRRCLILSIIVQFMSARGLASERLFILPLVNMIHNFFGKICRRLTEITLWLLSRKHDNGLP